jgi:hypothetical protein
MEQAPIIFTIVVGSDKHIATTTNVKPEELRLLYSALRAVEDSIFNQMAETPVVLPTPADTDNVQPEES